MICRLRQCLGRNHRKDAGRKLLALKTGRMLGDDVEGAFEGEAGAAEGAFFEEAADYGDAVGDAAGWGEFWDGAAGVRGPVGAGFGDFDETGAHGERGLAGEIGDGEHFVAEGRDEENVHFGKDAGHFFGDSAAQAIGLNKIHSGQEARLAEEVWPSVVGLDLELVRPAA